MAGGRCGGARILSTLWCITFGGPWPTLKATTRYNNGGDFDGVERVSNRFISHGSSRGVYVYAFASFSTESTENCVCILHNLSYQLEAELPKSYARDFGDPLQQSSAPEPKAVGCFAHRSAKITEVILSDNDPH